MSLRENSETNILSIRRENIRVMDIRHKNIEDTDIGHEDIKDTDIRHENDKTQKRKKSHLKSKTHVNDNCSLARPL